MMYFFSFLVCFFVLKNGSFGIDAAAQCLRNTGMMHTFIHTYLLTYTSIHSYIHTTLTHTDMHMHMHSYKHTYHTIWFVSFSIWGGWVVIVHSEVSADLFQGASGERDVLLVVVFAVFTVFVVFVVFLAVSTLQISRMFSHATR
jgi:hypothetical protein